MMNRGSESNFYVVGDKGIVARDAYGPGQSGFISAEGSRGKHFADQLEMFEAFETKPLPLSKEKVDEMTEQVIELEVE